MAIALNDHPYRAAIMDEVHARPVDIIPETCRLRRLVFVTPAEVGAMQRVLQRFADFCASIGAPAPGAGDRQHGFATASRQVTWEFHTEFVSVA